MLARDYPPCPGRKIYPKPKYKSFGDQAFFGQDGWILASFFFVGLWTSTPSWSINTQIKRGREKNREKKIGRKELSSLVNTPYLLVNKAAKIHMPKGLSRPILALASYFDQFYSLFFGLVDNQAKKQYFKDKIVRWLQLGKLLPLELHRNFTQERFKWDCLH